MTELNQILKDGHITEEQYKTIESFESINVDGKGKLFSFFVEDTLELVAGCLDQFSARLAACDARAQPATP